MAIATTVSNLGELLTDISVLINTSRSFALTANNLHIFMYVCMYVCSKKLNFNCPKCAEEISLDECFKDKAAENELKTATIKCTNQDCPWEGPGKFYVVSTCTALSWGYTE